MKRTQGSVETSSFGQMECIRDYGEYCVGVGRNEILRSVSMAVRVEINSQEGHRQPPESFIGKVYTFDELRDLESRLVLIGGNYSKGRDEVDKYLKV